MHVWEGLIEKQPKKFKRIKDVNAVSSGLLRNITRNNTENV